MDQTRQHRTLCLSLVLAAVSAFPQKQSPRILIGPNILASPNEAYRHEESMLAANPTNPMNLVATSISGSRPDTGGATRTYSSFDGGYSWTSSGFPEQWNLNNPAGAADPQVAFGPKGTAFFITLGGKDSKPGVREDAFYVYRSEDGGRHWERPLLLPVCDHPQIVVDKTGGKFDGNVYIGVLTHHNKKRVVGVFRSQDDGKSFEGPIVAVEAKDGIQVTTPVVLGDGTLFVPYTEFDIKKDGGYTEDRPIAFVTSSDGGLTYSKPQPVAVQRTIERVQRPADRTNANPALGLSFDWPVEPSFAVDCNGSEFRDRLYAVWTDSGPGNNRVLFTYSQDRGRSWTKPRQLSADVPANAYQYQPALAVNNRGVLGIQWFDTRNSIKQDSYDLYFAASVDGGKSFLPVRRVTSESSFPAGKGNLTPAVAWSTNDGKAALLNLKNPYLRHPNGGDYMFFDSDSKGVFHPFWVDGRSGMQQLWTAQIRVEDNPAKEKLARHSAVARDVTQDVLMIAGPIVFDDVTNQAVIDIRLKNIAEHRIAGPLTVTVQSFGWSNKEVAAAAPGVPVILNAVNHASDRGAVFDYSSALRDLESLAPGEITEAVRWRLQLSGLGQGITLKVQVTSSGAAGIEGDGQ